MSTDLSQDPVFWDDDAEPPPAPVSKQIRMVELHPSDVVLRKADVDWCLRMLELLHNRDMPMNAVSDIAYHIEKTLCPIYTPGKRQPGGLAQS